MLWVRELFADMVIAWRFWRHVRTYGAAGGSIGVRATLASLKTANHFAGLAVAEARSAGLA